MFGKGSLLRNVLPLSNKTERQNSQEFWTPDKKLVFILEVTSEVESFGEVDEFH